MTIEQGKSELQHNVDRIWSSMHNLQIQITALKESIRILTPKPPEPENTVTVTEKQLGEAWNVAVKAQLGVHAGITADYCIFKKALGFE